jgi:hypothetical protein
MKFPRYNNTTWFLLIFAAAWLLRVGFIVVTPQMNSQIDLNIYVDGGQLVSNGINPYVFTEGGALRHQLRTDSTAFHPYTCNSQSRWDYYASSNLPLSLIFYGTIDFFSTGNGFLYRLVSAFFDALLGVLIVFFMLQAFGKKQFSDLSFIEKILSLGLGVLSPILFFWGVIMPEEKGIQSLLMLAALMTARSNKWLLSALLLGFSVAFKGLGVFIAPLCCWYIIGQPTVFKDFISNKNLRKPLIYIGLSLFSALIWFVPFYPEILNMMGSRLNSNINSNIPTHGAIGRLIYAGLGNHWLLVKNIFTFIFIGIHALLFYKKRFSFEVFTASLLLFFVDISLQNGSLDRMNIGFLIATLLICISNLANRKLLLWYYVFGSSLLFLIAAWAKFKQVMDFEQFDSIFGLGFVLVYTFILISNLRNLKTQ